MRRVASGVKGDVPPRRYVRVVHFASTFLTQQNENRFERNERNAVISGRDIYTYIYTSRTKANNNRSRTKRMGLLSRAFRSEAFCCCICGCLRFFPIFRSHAGFARHEGKNDAMADISSFVGVSGDRGG